MIPYTQLRPSNQPFFYRICSDKESCVIDYAVDSVNSFLKDVIQCRGSSTRLLYKAFDVISNHSKFETCSIDTKLKVLSRVYERIKTEAEADPYEVRPPTYHFSIMYDSLFFKIIPTLMPHLLCIFHCWDQEQNKMMHSCNLKTWGANSKSLPVMS
jgi:hypothetical protein